MPRNYGLPASRVITSAEEAIDALGGANFVAELFGIGPNAVRNWYRRGFPPEAYALLAPRLRQAGCEFSDKLFRQYPVADPDKAAAQTARAKKRGGR
jgi:hypothetical protein